MQFINKIKKFCKKINYVPTNNKLIVLTKNKNKQGFPSFNALSIETRREIYSVINNTN